MSVHAGFVRVWRRLPVDVAIGVGAAGMFGASEPAHAMDPPDEIVCGKPLGPRGEPWVLSKDLVCKESPGLTVEGPADVDLEGHTVSCVLSDGGSLAKDRAKDAGSAVKDAAKSLF